MGYALEFYKIDLAKLKEAAHDKPADSSECNQFLAKTVESLGSYSGSIEHPSGSGALFEKYIRTIASDYFCEPKIFELMMNRNDLFPFTETFEWGYLKLEEIRKLLHSASARDSEIYFEENDDFEEDLEELESIFESSSEESLDLICLYS